MAHPGFFVPPRSKKEIYGLAGKVRGVLKPLTSSAGYVDLKSALEWMRELLPGFDFESIEAAEMGADHGRTWPDRCLIHLREDVYDGMCRGSGRDRFTTGHELGHLFLHRGVAFARALDANAKAYYNSEWQANTFASALLIDEVQLRQCETLEEVMERFGVSYDAARVRFKR